MELLFQAMASAMTRAAPAGSETSAEMYWKRWVGDAAEAYFERGGVRMGDGREGRGEGP